MGGMTHNEEMPVLWKGDLPVPAFMSTKTEGEKLVSEEEEDALRYVERHHQIDEGHLEQGYHHCLWCGEEWPCTAIILLRVIQRGSR